MKVGYQAIGVIRSPFRQPEGMPIQPAGAAGVKGRIVVRSAYRAGLKDLAGFSHVILLYHFHRRGKPRLVVQPFLGAKPRGVFATRAPARPNAIGLSVVRLVRIRKNVLTIENVDVLDGTPLLDIKPYVPAFDRPRAERIGWLKKTARRVRTRRADGRFSGARKAVSP
jgi:tRNA-Thr(GGU) m(6)t(6)A37 methyltransferase TsaA